MRTSVEKSYIEARISDVSYHRIPGTTATICNIEMVNGFSVRGESACVDPKNFDEALGRKIAYENAFQNLWQLEGYLLAEERRRHALGIDNDYAGQQLRWHGNLCYALMDVLKVGDPELILAHVERLVQAQKKTGCTL